MLLLFCHFSYGAETEMSQFIMVPVYGGEVYTINIDSIVWIKAYQETRTQVKLWDGAVLTLDIVLSLLLAHMEMHSNSNIDIIRALSTTIE